MPRVWGSWSATSSTGARYRVGLDYSISGTRITVDKYVFESAYSIYKSVTLKRTGKLSGTYSVRADTAGGVVSLGRGGSFTGSRGSTYTVGGKVTNILHGLTCSVSAKIKIPAAAPSKPSKPSIGSITNTRFKATLSKAPASNGASISRYEWQVQNVDSGGTSTANTSGRTWTRTNNKPNTRYRVRVRARNSAGVSAYSSWSNTIRTKPNSPAAPTGVTATRSSDSRINLSWNHRGSSSAPYSSQRVERREISPSGSWASWKSLGTVGASASSYADTTTKANQQYQYRIMATNAGGSATSGASSSVRTTPAAPTIGTATKSGDDIRVTYSVNTPYTNHLTHLLQDRPDGGSWVTVATQVGTGSLTHVDPDPAVTHQYRVITRSTYGGNLDSAPSGTSSIVQLQAPPNAPTILEPTAGVHDASQPILIRWRHNPVDASEQSAAQVQYRHGGAGLWETAAQISGTTSSYELAPIGGEGLLEVRVRTKGDHVDYGPYGTRSITLGYRPYAVINEPTPGTLSQSEIELEWGYSQDDDSPQVAWEGRLWNYDTGDLLEEQSVSTSSNTGRFDTTLEDGVTYRIDLRVRAANGLWSHDEGDEWETVIVTAQFPLPVRYRPEVMWDEDAGSAGLTFLPVDEEETFEWDGLENESTSTRETADGTVTNLFTNPDMVKTTAGEPIRENLVKTPAPWSTRLDGWHFIRRPVGGSGGNDYQSKRALRTSEGPPELPSDFPWMNATGGDNSIFLDGARFEITAGYGEEYRSDVRMGYSYSAAMYVYREWGLSAPLEPYPARLAIRWFDSTGGEIRDTEGTSLDVADSEWVRLTASGRAPNGARYASVVAVMDSPNSGAQLEITGGAAAILEEETSGDYFDGTYNPSDEYETSWEGSEGLSVSKMVTTTSDVVVWENLIPDPDPTTAPGRYTATGITASSHEDGRLITFEDAMESGNTTFYRTVSSNGHTSVEEGEGYSARGGVRNISDWPVTLRFGMIRRTGASLVLSSARSNDVTVQPGEYVEIEVPGIELNDTWNTVRVGWVAPSEGEIPAGTEIVLSDGFTVMKGPRAPLLVSTVFSPDPDLTPQARPEGGSQLVGQQVAGVSALRGVVVKSSQWSKSQGVSARFITTEEAAGNNLPLGIVEVFGSPVGGVVVWRRQGATIGEFEFATGDSNLSILTGTGDASDPAVNAPGETLMRVELGEIAPNGVQVYLPGGGNVGDSVWFDILTVTDESYDGPPFSGATPTDIQGSTIKTWNGEAWKVEALDHESLAVGAVTANTIRANAITSAKIASDAIEARHIQTGTIQAGDGIIGSLDAGVISAGTLDADRIGAKTITAEKLLIGRPRDLAPGPGGYEDLYDLGSAAMFLGSSNDPTGRYIGISPDVSGASNRMVFGPMTPVREGEIISWESYATYGGTNPATNWSTYLYWYDVNGDALDPERTVITTESASGGSTGWSRATVEVPEGAEWARARFYSVYDEAATGNRGFRNFDIRVQTSGTLIEDGAITTDKIAANAVEATNIAANAITSDKIEANAITGDKIRANAIDGMTITGATIQTSPEAISQIKLDQNSLVVNSSAPGIEIDRWYSVPLRGFSSIDQFNGYVVGTTLENPSVMILNSKGEIYAFRSAGNALADSVTITGGYAYVVHPNGSVWRAVDPFTSFSVWTTARRADKISSHSSGGVYGIHTGDNVVFSYNSSGSVAWTKTHSSPTSIHVTSNRVFVGLTGTTNRVIELDLSGNLIQAFTVNHFGEYLLVQDGVAYISNADDKKVYVEELGSGQVLLTLSQGGDAVPGGLMNYQGNLAIAWRSPTVGSSEGGVSFHSFTDESKEMVHIDSSSGVLTARSARLPGHSSIKSAEMSVIAPPVGESLNIINPLFKSGFNIVKSKAERLNSHQSFQEGAIVSEAGGIAGQSLWMRSSSRQENNHARNWIKIGPSAESLMGGDPSPSGKITGANLNTFNRDSGGWIQENDSYATSARNYPVNVGGILKVSRRTDFNEANNEFFTQEYITRETNSRYFIRHYIISSTGSKSWTPWTQIGGPDPSKPFAMASGTVSVTASGGIGETTVTFPSGRFTKTPQVFTTGNSAVTALQNTQIASPTTTSVRIVMQRSTGTATSVDWLAVQMEE